MKRNLQNLKLAAGLQNREVESLDLVSFKIPKWEKGSVVWTCRYGINQDPGTVGADSQPVQGRHVLAEAVMGKLLQRGVHHGPDHNAQTHTMLWLYLPLLQKIRMFCQKGSTKDIIVTPESFSRSSNIVFIIMHIRTHHFLCWKLFDSQIFQRLKPSESILRQEPQRVMVQHPGTKMNTSNVQQFYQTESGCVWLYG